MDRTEAVEVLTKMLDCEDIDFCDSDCFKCRLFTKAVDRSNALIMGIEALDKDINVPSKSALDHIHNVVRDDAYRRGYEQGKADANHPEIPDSWIPVSERLPEKEDCPMDCLVTRKSKNIGNYTDMAVAESDGTWTHEDWKAITFGDRVLGKKAGLISTRDDDIVAWMHLPEPYKEGEENENVN